MQGWEREDFCLEALGVVGCRVHGVGQKVHRVTGFREVKWVKKAIGIKAFDFSARESRV